MKLDAKMLTVNGIDYLPKDSVHEKAMPLDGMDYVIVRTYSAGVFAGYMKRREGKEVELEKARRLWYWVGAASLSQMAEVGTSRPDECKFPCEVANVILTEAIEILSVTAKAREIIAGVAVWQA